MNFALGIIFLLSVSSVVFGQELPEKRPPQRVDNADGWEVPDTTSLDVLKSSRLFVGGSEIVETRFKLPESKPTIPIEIGKDNHCEFRRLFSYAFEDKVIALGGECVVMYFRGSVRNYAAATMNFLFFDEDGDGKFEFRYNISGSSDNLHVLFSRWIKNHKLKK